MEEGADPNAQVEQPPAENAAESPDISPAQPPTGEGPPEESAPVNATETSPEKGPSMMPVGGDAPPAEGEEGALTDLGEVLPPEPPGPTPETLFGFENNNPEKKATVPMEV